MGSTPRFSIVVPTRDRPEFVGRCIRSVAAQTFEDFEVIVGDNPVSRPATHVVDELRDERFRCVAAPEPLNMPDNWEFAVSQTTGDFVTVLPDKFLMHPSALEAVDQVLSNTDADHVTWRGEGYHLLDESRSIDDGLYQRQLRWSSPERFEPRDELVHRLSMSVRLTDEGAHLFRGKICYGVHARSLIDRIRGSFGRLFPPINPDYTSTVAALASAGTAMDMGRPCVLWVNSVVGTGYRSGIDSLYTRQFLLDVGCSLDALPIPGLYASLHNCVAHDIVASVERVGMTDQLPALDLANLTRRAREDLAFIRWSSADERDDQYAILERAEALCNVQPSRAVRGPRSSAKARLQRAVRLRLAAHPRIDRVTRSLLRRPRRYASALDAVEVADRHFSSAAPQPPRAVPSRPDEHDVPTMRAPRPR